MNRRAQSTIEMMLYVSVMIIGLSAAAYVIIGPLKLGYERVSDDAAQVLPESLEQGANERR